MKSRILFAGLFIGSLFFFIFLFTDCGHRKTHDEVPEEYGVTEADSLSIVNASDEIMRMLQAEDIDGAAEKLRHFNKMDTVVTPLTEEDVNMLRKRQMIFPVKKFEILETEFADPLDNTVVYTVEFGDPSPDTGEAPKTKLAFNAVMIDGEYYITLKEKR